MRKKKAPTPTLDPVFKYHVVKNGKVLPPPVDCVHTARRRALFRKAQLWFMQQSGVPVMIEDFGG